MRFNLRTDKIVVLDTERNMDPLGAGQVVEVGIVLVDLKEASISQPWSFLIKTDWVSGEFTSFTGITKQEIELKGQFREDLSKALKKEFKLDRRLIVGWGDEREPIEEVLADPSGSCSTPYKYLDLGAWFTVTRGYDRSVSLQDALRHEGLTFDGRPHRAGPDAYNTAKLVLKMAK
jgi:inhibitor of KinA sporulation pathway (predicted exonuclease)